MGWHRRMSRMGKRLTKAFGTPCTMHFAAGPSVPLSAVFDLGTRSVDSGDGIEVLEEVPRAGVYREDIDREPVPFEDTIEVEDLEVDGGKTIAQGIYTITEVRKDEGSVYQLFLRERT